MIISNSPKMLRSLNPALENSSGADSSSLGASMICVESAFEDCSLFMAELKVSQITLLCFETSKGYFKKLKNLC